MDLFILKTDVEKFTSTNEKTLHLIFKGSRLGIERAFVCNNPADFKLMFGFISRTERNCFKFTPHLLVILLCFCTAECQQCDSKLIHEAIN